MGWERGGVTHSKGTHAGSRTRVHCSEDKASAHGTPALPTELNGAPHLQTLSQNECGAGVFILFRYGTFTSSQRTSKIIIAQYLCVVSSLLKQPHTVYAHNFKAFRSRICIHFSITKDSHLQQWFPTFFPWSPPCLCPRQARPLQPQPAYTIRIKWFITNFYLQK